MKQPRFWYFVLTQTRTKCTLSFVASVFALFLSRWGGGVVVPFMTWLSHSLSEYMCPLVWLTAMPVGEMSFVWKLVNGQFGWVHFASLENESICSLADDCVWMKYCLYRNKNNCHLFTLSNRVKDLFHAVLFLPKSTHKAFDIIVCWPIASLVMQHVETRTGCLLIFFRMSLKHPAHE